MKVINLFGGPGTGKSTTAAGTFFNLKLRGCNVELVTEYAKDMVWEDRHNILQDQLYIFAKQARRVERLRDKLGFVVTDSPIILGLLYTPENYYESFPKFVREVYDSYDNINIFLARVKEYNPIGRLQTEDEAKEIDTKIKDFLNLNNIQYNTIVADKDAPLNIIKLLEDLGYIQENK